MGEIRPGIAGNFDIDQLVRPEQGLISRRIFTDEGVYATEIERIFGRTWLLLGHETQIPKAGDFFTTTMGEDPVIVARQRDGTVGAYLNSCRHRGMKVCRVDSGNAKTFVCSYHGWAYGLDGGLVGRSLNVSYPASRPVSSHGLLLVPRIESYKGLIFGNWDADCDSLLHYLGDAAWYLDAFVDRRDGGTEVIGGVNRWIINCNWKFAAEQFVSDAFHTFTSHASAIQAMLADLPPEVLASLPKNRIPTGLSVVTPHGHGSCFAVGDTPRDPATAMLRGPVVHQYYLEARDAFVAKLGEDKLGPMGTTTTLFPNFSFLAGGAAVMRVWHPRGPHKMEVQSWVLVDRAAPEHVKQAQKQIATRLFSPSGFVEQDDGENWAETQKIVSARGRQASLDMDYSMGLELSDIVDRRFPGKLGEFLTEMPARGFYRRYRELMSG